MEYRNRRDREGQNAERERSERREDRPARGTRGQEGVVAGRNAVAEALRSGKLGIMDYYNMQNIQADTAMRNAISGDKKEDKK